MKKLLSLLLALVLCLSMAACGGANQDADKGGQAAVDVPDLVAATQKLSSASSLQFTFRVDQSGNGYSHSTYQTYQMIKKDDSIQIRVDTQQEVPNGMGDTNLENCSFYYEDKLGYYEDLSMQPRATTKVMNSENFTLYDAVSAHSDLSNPNTTGFIETFAALNPTASVQDGLTVCTKELTLKDYVALIAALTGDDDFSEESFTDITIDSMVASASVDAQGYLCDITLKTEVQGITGTISLALTQINQLQSIEVPDIAKNFAYTQNTCLDIWDGPIRAHYRYEDWTVSRFVDDEGWVDETYTGLGFVGFGDYYADDYNVALYEIPAEIDGTPVTYVQDILYNHFSSVTVDQLVIPAGTVVNLCGALDETGAHYYCENTTLFFHDTKDAAISNVHTADEPDLPSDTPIAKAIYYAGEWEYVDGIPTPIG